MQETTSKWNRLISLLLAAALFIGMIPVSLLPVMAEEIREPVTATLQAVQDGTAAFAETSENTVTVKSGDQITVKVTPNEGYFCDSLALFGEDNSETALVTQNTATFTVNENIIVYPVFSKEGSAGSSAMKPVNVSQRANVADIEEYILKNADIRYVGPGEQAIGNDLLTVTTTLVDGGMLPDATLDKLWADEDKDGVSDNYTALLSHSSFMTPLFEINPRSGYYAAWVGADIDGGVLTDWDAAKNNLNAEMLDGFVMDKRTGIIYVPKKYTKENRDGQNIIDSSRIQLLYTVPSASSAVSFDFSGESVKVKGNVAENGKVTLPASSVYSEIILANDEDALHSVKSNTVDCVTVNGVPYTQEDNAWSYDAESGALTVYLAPTAIHCMEVEMSNSFGKGVKRAINTVSTAVKSIFGVNTVAANANFLPGTWKFKIEPNKVTDFLLGATNVYSDVNGSASGVNPYVMFNSDEDLLKLMGQHAWIDADLSKLHQTSGLAGDLLYWRTTISPQENSTVKITEQMILDLMCAHVGINKDGNYQYHYNSATPGKIVRIFVKEITGNTAIIGVAIPTQYTQAGVGFFKIRWEPIEPIKGTIKIKKVDDSGKALSGAEFTLKKYDAGSKTTTTIDTKTSSSDGWITWPELKLDFNGHYIVEETRPPAGYTNSVKPWGVVLNAFGPGNNYTVTLTDHWENARELIDIPFKKIILASDKANAPLACTSYTVKYELRRYSDGGSASSSTSVQNMTVVYNYQNGKWIPDREEKFTGMPKVDTNGKLYHYYVQETDAYETKNPDKKMVNVGSSNNTFTNTISTTAAFIKTWNDANNKDKIRPDLTVTLVQAEADGTNEKTVNSVVIDPTFKNTAWQSKGTGVRLKTDSSGSKVEGEFLLDSSGKPLPMYYQDSKGLVQAYQYTVKEELGEKKTNSALTHGEDYITEKSEYNSATGKWEFVNTLSVAMGYDKIFFIPSGLTEYKFPEWLKLHAYRDGKEITGPFHMDNTTLESYRGTSLRTSCQDARGQTIYLESKDNVTWPVTYRFTGTASKSSDGESYGINISGSISANLNAPDYMPKYAPDGHEYQYTFKEELPSDWSNAYITDYYDSADELPEGIRSSSPAISCQYISFFRPATRYSVG